MNRPTFPPMFQTGTTSASSIWLFLPSNISRCIRSKKDLNRPTAELFFVLVGNNPRRFLVVAAPAWHFPETFYVAIFLLSVVVSTVFSFLFVFVWPIFWFVSVFFFYDEAISIPIVELSFGFPILSLVALSFVPARFFVFSILPLCVPKQKNTKKHEARIY